MSKSSEQPRVLIVSPVRNEARHIDKVARAVAAQELAPARWVAIDDGSTDGTYELLKELEGEIDLLTVMPRACRGRRTGRARAQGSARRRQSRCATSTWPWPRWTARSTRT